MGKIDEVEIDVSILTPEAPPRLPRAQQLKLPAYLRPSFDSELGILEQILIRGSGSLSGYSSRGAAFAARLRFYKARTKQRLLAEHNQAFEQVTRYDNVCINLLPYKQGADVFWCLRFKVERPVLVLDNEEIS